MGLGKIFAGIFYGRYDKAVHFLASAAVTAVLLTVVAPLPAAAAAFGGGLLKELYDWKVRRTTVAIGDLGANALGIAVAVGVYSIAVLVVAGRLA